LPWIPQAAGKPDTETDIAWRAGVSRQTIHNVEKDFEQAVDIIILACSTPPVGHSTWTLRLFVDSLFHMTVRRLLKNGT
jgi:DNA-binding XRE family transcriptional regulator